MIITYANGPWALPGSRGSRLGSSHLAIPHNAAVVLLDEVLAQPPLGGERRIAVRAWLSPAVPGPRHNMPGVTQLVKILHWAGTVSPGALWLALRSRCRSAIGSGLLPGQRLAGLWNVHTCATSPSLRKKKKKMNCCKGYI